MFAFDSLWYKIILKELAMRKILIATFVLALLALDWAALHDILKGEANVQMEWTFVLGSALLLITVFIRKVIKRIPIF